MFLLLMFCCGNYEMVYMYNVQCLIEKNDLRILIETLVVITHCYYKTIKTFVVY